MLSPARRSYSEYLFRFLIAHGSPNYGHSGICAMQKMFAFTYTLGSQPNPDYNNADLIVIWGKQPIYSGASKGGVKSLVDARDSRRDDRRHQAHCRAGCRHVRHRGFRFARAPTPHSHWVCST